MVKQLYTTSSGRAFNRCRREYYISNVLGMSSVETAKALLWGRVWDAVQAYLWTPDTVWDPTQCLNAAVSVEGDSWDKLDDVDRVNIEVLTAGYIARWMGADSFGDITRIATKLRFETKLRNPETNGASPLWSLAGELDAIAIDRGEHVIVEHKSSGQNIEPGSPYWEKLKLDSQCSNYFEGARSLGYEPTKVIYDVVRKPMLQRLLATPEDQRKYTKPTKTEPSRLYANQREHDETLDEYRARLVADVAARPEFYFARCEVVRLASEEEAAALDVWETCQAINQCARRERWPRNTDACERYGRMCQFWPVCTGMTTLDNEEKYQHVGSHPELER